MRLNRFLAAAGLGSRRGVEELIRTGQVRVNGKVVETMATQVSPEDVVKVGSRVLKQEEPLYAAVHKPPGYVVTSDDERDRRTVFDLVPAEWPRSFAVGRLDRDSEGLLILTNDGELSLALTHPRYKVEKEYEVTVDQPFDPAHREKLLRGFHIIGGRAKMEEVEIMATQRIRVVLRQGLKRQIRLMLYELGYEVAQLRRVRIGPLTLGRLRPGEWRRLAPREVAALKAPGKNAGPETSPEAGTGPQAGAGVRPKARAGAGTRTRAGTGARATTRARTEGSAGAKATTRASTGTKPRAGTGAKPRAKAPRAAGKALPS